jgi:hypothetical protein
MKTKQAQHIPQPPTFWKILNTDYASWICLVTPLTLWAFFIILKLLRPSYSDEPLYLSISAGATIIGILIAVYRIFSTLNLLNRGIPVKGKITRIQNMRGMGQVAYEFKQDGAKHLANLTYRRGKKSFKLNPGMAVTILVDPKNPRKSLIKELYYV